MKKKLAVLFLAMIVQSVIYAETDINNNQVNVSKLQEAEIFIEEENYADAQIALEAEGNKDSAQYNYLLGKIEEKKGNYRNAEENYKKAILKDRQNKYYRFVLINLHIKNGESLILVKNEAEEILLLNDITESEKDELKSILKGEKLKNKYIKSADIHTGIVVTDNVKETKENKKTDSGSATDISYTIIKSFEKNRYLGVSAGYKNTIYFKNSEETTHLLYLGSEYEAPCKNLKILIPTVLSIKIKDNDTEYYDIRTALKMKKNIGKLNISYGVEAGYKDNKLSNYSGVDFDILGKIEKNIGNNVNLSTELVLGRDNYNKEEYKNNNIATEFEAVKAFNKYEIKAAYSLKYEIYNYKIDGDKDRKDMTHNISAGIYSKIGNSKWGYDVKYEFEYDDSNSIKYDYMENRVSAEIGREF